jgi:ArsR family transcriptional regulator, arsenate/arsenite/antimonite-responsive transcriptional repressor
MIPIGKTMTRSGKAEQSVEFAKAIADSTRQKIMRYCCCGWRSVNEVAEEMGVTQPTVSHHLAILRQAGLVEIRHQGKQTFYRLNQERMAACCGELTQIFAPERGKAASPSIDS